MLCRRWWPVAAWLVVLRIESSDLGSSVNSFSLLYRISMAVFGHVNLAMLETFNAILRKSGHFFGYAILSLLVFQALKYTDRDRLRLVLQRRWGIFFRDLWRWDWALIAILFTVTAASFDEIHQAFLASRSSRWQDVAIDMSGAIAMQLLLYARASHAMNLQKKQATERSHTPLPR